MSGKRVRALGVVAVVLVAAGGLGALLLTRDATEAQPATVVVGDFESGSLEGWRAVGGGAGGWLVYTDGQKAPDPARSDPNMPFNVADPPRGKFAVVSDMNGPGTQILFRDVRLDGRFRLDMIVFYFGSVPFSTPETLARLLTKELPGFGELFRMLSFQEIGAAAMLSRACAGLVDRTVVMLMPGSTPAVRLAMDRLILPELAHLVELAAKGEAGAED